MLKRKKIAIASIACLVVALTLSVAATPAVAKHKKKTTVIGQITHDTGVDANGQPAAAFFNAANLTSKTVKNPKPGSITVNVTAVPHDPATPNSIYVSGVVECKKNPKDAITKYAVGADVKGVPSPFSVKAPFPYGVPRPAACHVFVNSNIDVPLEVGTKPYPSAVITITILWRH
jgi:hypothetical protein